MDLEKKNMAAMGDVTKKMLVIPSLDRLTDDTLESDIEEVMMEMEMGMDSGGRGVEDSGNDTTVME